MWNHSTFTEEHTKMELSSLKGLWTLELVKETETTNKGGYSQKRSRPTKTFQKKKNRLNTKIKLTNKMNQK